MNCKGIVKAFVYALIFIGANTAFAQAPSFTYPAGNQNYVTGTAINPLNPFNVGGAIPPTIYGQTTTFAGDGTHGFADGTGTAASISSPVGIAVDASSNLYVTSFFLNGIPFLNDMIRKITPASVVTTLAGSVGGSGSTNGQGTAASFFAPNGVTVDVFGNVYVADLGNNLIREITKDGVVTTLAGDGTAGMTNGPVASANFNAPAAIAIDGFGNLYVVDYSSNLIRKIVLSTGQVTTLAGGGPDYGIDGTGNQASFHNPEGLVVDNAGNVYVTDGGDQDIRKITKDGVVTTFAGSTTSGNADGLGNAASFNRPIGIGIDLGGNLYVADTYNYLIRKITPAGLVTTLAGSGSPGAANGIGTAASFNDSEGIGVDINGNVYVGDKGNNLVRKITATGYTISPALPAGLYFDGTSGIISGKPTSPSPTTVYTITGYNVYGSASVNVTITVTGNAITHLAAPVIAYQTPQVYKVNLTISPLAPTNSGGAVPAELYANATIFAGSGAPGSHNDTGQQATFTSPDGVAMDAAGNLYVADAGNNLIRKITPAGVVTTLAGSGTPGNSGGTGTDASFNKITGIAVDAAGNVYVAEAGNNDIRKINALSGQVTTFASGFNKPEGVTVDGVGNVYVADLGNNQIKKITPAGVVSVFAGSGGAGSTNDTGIAATFNAPSGLAFDQAGYLYVADSGDNLIRKITPGGLVSTLAGSGAAGSADGVGTAASFKSPAYLTVDDNGNVYVTDAGNNLIRKITPGGTVTTLAGDINNPGRANGQGTAARFNNPRGIVVDANGNLFIGDLINNIIREVSTSGYTIDKTLPAGLTFDGTTGIISGTPTAASPATIYTITAYNAGGSSTCTVNITVQIPLIVAVPPPAISYVTPQNYIINTGIILLSPANTGGDVPATIYGQVSTFAGSGTSGNSNGTGTAASFSVLHAIATDLVGNSYFIDNNVIKEISPSGVVTTLAGSGAAGSANGQGTAASFNQPDGIAVDGAGNVYVADTKNNTIRMITQAGQVTTLAGSAGVAGLVNGSAAAARFNAPQGITVDTNGNIYIADTGNNLIREISSSGAVTTFAGSGSPGNVNGGTGASFNKPVSVTADRNGNIYVADEGNNLIRKITPTGAVSTFAGSGSSGAANGTGTGASFNNPLGVSADIAGNVYVADAGNNLIRKITPAQVVSTLAGNGSAGAVNGALTVASFNNPDGVSADISGNVYVVDFNNYLIRKIVTTGYTIDKTLPPGLTFDGTTGIVSGTPTALSPTTIYTVTAYNIGGSSVTTISITVSDKAVPPVPPPVISYQSPNVYTVNTAIAPLVPANTGGALPDKTFGLTTTLAGTGTAGSANGTGTAASFNQPFGLAIDNLGNIYVADHLNNDIRKITPAGVVSVFAGSGAVGSADGVGTAATFNSPTGVAVDGAGNVYVADVSNNLIRKISPGGVVTTLAGSISGGQANGTGTAATFSNPSGIAVDAGGNIYVADLSNNRIRKITPGGVVTTLAGTGISGNNDGPGNTATFSQPYGLAVDQTGNVYVADWGNNLIRKITPDGVVSTLAGSGQAGATDGLGTAASFDKPFGITVDEQGNLYVADTDNELIRKITPDGNVTTVAGTGKSGAVNGVGTTTSFYQPTGVVADGSGNVYVTDEFNDLIRQIVVVSNFTIDKPVPPGLKFDNTTGIITGNPTAPSPTTIYNITAYNLGGSSSFPVSITVNALPQSITFNPVIAKTYGDADFDPGATSNNTTIPIAYASDNPAVFTVVNGQIHITGAGTATITASQPGNNSFLAASPMQQILTITPASLTITADNKSMPFGTPIPVLTATYSGFVYNDKPASLTSLPVITTTAFAKSTVGQYPITVGDAASTNYTFTYVAGVLTINPAPALIQVPNAFTPNGDGINDVWHIEALIYFPNCTVTVFNRYGGLVYQSHGYPQPWDGTFNGKPLPVGTYYYIINPQSDSPPLSGPLTIIR